MFKMGKVISVCILFVFLLPQKNVSAQCPPNIGFELGTFDYWSCSIGAIDKNGLITLSTTSNAVPDRQVMYKNSVPQLKDPYGNFPVNSPNGSDYSIKLGNDGTGSQAEAVSYTFTVPANQNIYSLIYNYAVVFQNPSHIDYQQPKFTAKVFNVTDNQYIDCGGFTFVAAANLPGFQLSTVGSSVFYKTWSPVTLKLLGYAGKTIRLEFATNDCTLGGHFGYAYIDVNENCSSPISGNVYCNGQQTVNLAAPYGFQGYRWFDANFSQVLSTSNILTVTPAPPAGTVYALEITPFPNQGCLDTLYTTIMLSPDAFDLKVAASAGGCSGGGVDLTAAKITAGSTPGLKFSYFSDPNQLNFVPSAKSVTTSGTYYIKGVNSAGCTDIQSINVNISPTPKMVVTPSIIACVPDKADLTDSTVTAGSDAGLTLSYWKDLETTVPLNNPNAIDIAGTYFIKGDNGNGCSSVMYVAVAINIAASLSTNNITVCGSADITGANVKNASPSSFSSYTYWLDAQATQAIIEPAKITSSGVYYILGNGYNGCNVTKPLTVTVNPFADFIIPAGVTTTIPNAVDLTSVVPNNGLIYTYWKDKNATQAVTDPTNLFLEGTYYIKGNNTFGCAVTKPLNVIVKDAVVVPPNVFSPNGDGVNDTWEIPLLKYYPYCSVDIFDRNGHNIFSSKGYNKSWDGMFKGSQLPVTTYYYIIKIKPESKPVSGGVTIIK